MALVNPTYRSIVEEMLQDPEALENIITASPSLAIIMLLRNWCFGPETSR